MTGHQSVSHERMTILGELGAGSFVTWIRRQAAKLGLSPSISQTGPGRIDIEVCGAVELIDMMEMGCTLGPIDVWVETIRRSPVTA